MDFSKCKHSLQFMILTIVLCPSLRCYSQDRGGFKEGDIIVPDHCASIPEAIAKVQHDGTVYIRKGIQACLSFP